MKTVWTGLGTAVALAVLFAAPAFAQTKEVTIGYQDMVVPYRMAQEAKEIEKQTGYKVNWKQFGGGGEVIKAMASGAVQIGEVGSAGVAAAVSRGEPYELFWILDDIGDAEALVAKNGSGINSVADLKGKKIGLNKGSNVHYLLVRALDKAGLKYADVELVFLPPADGRAGFEKGVIDAWVIWEPYRTAAEMSLGARTLTDGTGLVSNNDFFFVAKPFALARRELIDVVFGATRDVFAQAAKDIPGTAKTFSAAAGFPVTVLEATLSHRGFDVRPISSEVIDEQQRIADTFKEIGLIPVTIKVSDAVHKSGS